MRYLLVTLSLLISAPSLAQNWQSLDGPYGQVITGISIGSDKTVISASYFNGGFIQAQGTGEWKPVVANEQIRTTFAEFVGGTTYLLGKTGAVFISSDIGETWSRSFGVPEHNGELGPALVRVQDTLYMICIEDAYGNGLYVSHDAGLNWTRRCRLGFQYSIASDSAGRMMTVGHRGQLRTDDRFSSIEGPSIGLDYQFFCTATDSLGRFWIAGSMEHGVLHTRDRWSWALPDAQLPDTIWTVAVTPRGISYMGSSHGVHTSTDGGETWSEFNEGLPPGFVASYLYVAPDGHLYVGTNGAGIFKTADPVTREYAVIKQLEVKDPEKASMRLLKVVNSQIQIQVSAEADIEFFDVLGRPLLIDHFREGGSVVISTSQISQFTLAHITENGKTSSLALPMSR